MNKNNRQQLLAIIAIVALALLVGDRLVLTPLTRAWNSRAERITELKRQVNQGGLLLDRQNAIRTRWENMRTNTLPTEVSVAENQVLSAFDRWSRDSRIGISSIKPQWRRNLDQYATLECRVDAFGTLPALTRFLYEVEKSPLGLKVETINITARDDRGEQLALALQVSGLQLNPAP